MSGLVVAVANANVDGLVQGTLVHVDPDEWPEHFAQGILTRASAEQLAASGLEVSE